NSRSTTALIRLSASCQILQNTRAIRAGSESNQSERGGKTTPRALVDRNPPLRRSTGITDRPDILPDGVFTMNVSRRTALAAMSSLPFISAKGAWAQSTPLSHDEKLKWFREAKFGLFIHWGLYCIPAGEWQGKPIAGLGEWIMNRAKIPVAEYEKLAAQFNPVKFNADEWVRMAQDAGMKYLVITSKHHDGFAMFHSAVSKYNVYDATPFHRDVIAELSQACARKNIRF